MKRFFPAVIILLLLMSCGRAQLVVRFLDVGQADAAIIQCDGQTLMIDGGNVSDSRYIYSYLSNTLGIQRIDHMIATHPHEDHVGGLSAALNACAVGSVYSPVAEYDSKPFMDFVRNAEGQGLQIIIPQHGDTFSLGAASVTFVSVPIEQYKNTNDMSLVVRIEYGELSFLFMGDAEVQSQLRILDSETRLKSDVLKVGHHGSVSSSSIAFVDAVQPTYAVVSVGLGNDYGLPDMQILRMYSRRNCSLLRTDLHGQIIFRSTDGHSMTVMLKSAQWQQAEAVQYIGNRNTRKFHELTCQSINEIMQKNRVQLFSRDEAIVNGYSPCMICNP